jgi:ribosomal protein S6
MAKNKDIEVRDEELLDSGTDPRVYELGFHLDPEIASDTVKKSYQSIYDLIASKGPIVAEGAPQKISLAYIISRQETSGRRDFDSAYFAWIVYEATPEAHAEILSVVAEDKSVVRFIDLLTTKESARHAVEMHELALKMSEQAQEVEAAAPSDLDVALENATI